MEEFLSEAASKCGKNDIPEDDDDPERLKALLEWAATGFQPMGVDVLYKRTEAVEESKGEKEEDITNSTPTKRVSG